MHSGAAVTTSTRRSTVTQLRMAHHEGGLAELRLLINVAHEQQEVRAATHCQHQQEVHSGAQHHHGYKRSTTPSSGCPSKARLLPNSSAAQAHTSCLVLAAPLRFILVWLNPISGNHSFHRTTRAKGNARTHRQIDCCQSGTIP